MKLTRKAAKIMIKDRVAKLTKSYKKSNTPALNGGDLNKDRGVLSLLKSYKDDAGVKGFQQDSDDLYITSAILKRPANEIGLYKSFQEKYGESELLKAYNTTDFSDWIPTELSADIIQRVELERRVAGLFMRTDMPTDPWERTRKTGIPTALKGTEGTAPTKTYGTGDKITLSSEEMVVNTDLTYNLDEDSIVAMLPEIRMDIVTSIVEGEETAIVRGATDNSIESDNTAADDIRRVWNGLIKKAVDASLTTDISTFAAEDFSGLRKQMLKYGINPVNLAWIVGTSVYNQMLNLKDSSGNQVVMTLDKYGPQATILSGELGKLYGIPIIVSPDMRNDLNASGIYDGVTTTKAGVLLVYRPGFGIGDRRKMMVETDKNIETRRHLMVSSAREIFYEKYTVNATNPIVVYGVNVTA